MDLGKNQIQLFCLSNIATKWLLMKFYYTHRSVSCLAIIREIYSCSKWKSVQRPKARQCEETTEHPGLMAYLHKVPTLKVQGTLRKRKKKDSMENSTKSRPSKYRRTDMHMNSWRLIAQGLHSSAPCWVPCYAGR